MDKNIEHSIPHDYISIKISMDNYDGLAYLREHVQNMRGSLKLVT